MVRPSEVSPPHYISTTSSPFWLPLYKGRSPPAAESLCHDKQAGVLNRSAIPECCRVNRNFNPDNTTEAQEKIQNRTRHLEHLNIVSAHIATEFTSVATRVWGRLFCRSARDKRGQNQIRAVDPQLPTHRPPAAKTTPKKTKY